MKPCGGDGQQKGTENQTTHTTLLWGFDREEVAAGLFPDVFVGPQNGFAQGTVMGRVPPVANGHCICVAGAHGKVRNRLTLVKALSSLGESFVEGRG